MLKEHYLLLLSLLIIPTKTKCLLPDGEYGEQEVKDGKMCQFYYNPSGPGGYDQKSIKIIENGTSRLKSDYARSD